MTEPVGQAVGGYPERWVPWRVLPRGTLGALCPCGPQPALKSRGHPLREDAVKTRPRVTSRAVHIHFEHTTRYCSEL
jgi:hypothetical protein